MAGDWIKIEAETPDKPEIWEIAADLGIDPDAVLGKLIRVWLWFDSHTEKCNAPSVTKALLDRDVSCAGFCDSVVKSGWMVEQDGQLIIKDWWIHNGKTAKSRLLAAKRQSKLREKSNGDSVTKVTQSSLLERHLDVDVDVDVDVEEKEPSINKQTLIDTKKKNGLVAENQETKKDRKPRVSTQLVEKIFQDWKTILNHPGANIGKKRGDVIREAVRMGYTAEQMRDAFIGCARSSFHAGFNEQGKKYDDLELILRNEKNIDRFIAYSTQPPKPTWKPQDNTTLNVRREATKYYESACEDARCGIDIVGTGTTIDAESWEVLQPNLAH